MPSKRRKPNVGKGSGSKLKSGFMGMMLGGGNAPKPRIPAGGSRAGSSSGPKRGGRKMY